MAAVTQLPPVTVTGSSSGGSMSFGAMMAAELGSSLVSGLVNRSSAKSQERFQERMANTQYQRAAKDLEAAGLNRIIALGSPADSPGGAGYSMQKPDFNASSAADVNRKNSVYQRELMEAQRNNTEQATNTGKAQESLFSDQAGSARAAAAASQSTADLNKVEARIKQVEADFSEKSGVPLGMLNSVGGTAAGALVSGAKALKNVPKLIKGLFK
jgi:hypothetical protein